MGTSFDVMGYNEYLFHLMRYNEYIFHLMRYNEYFIPSYEIQCVLCSIL